MCDNNCGVILKWWAVSPLIVRLDSCLSYRYPFEEILRKEDVGIWLHTQTCLLTQS